MAIDKSDNIYVADQGNNRIRKIGIDGNVTTFAGSGTAASVNGTGTAASFNAPTALAFDASGNLYVAELGSNLIRKITPGAVVTTFAGSGAAGSTNGTGTSASFNAPVSLAADALGNIYVSDQNNNQIRKITPAGVVSTFAGSTTAGALNGTGAAASFNHQAGITIDRSGNIYVADAGNYLIRKITPAGVITTLAGTGAAGNIYNTGTLASFTKPVSLSVDNQGNLTLTDNYIVKKIALTGYYVSPALPAGLVFDSTNGKISGTPASISSDTYTVTGASVYGNSNTTLKIETTIPKIPPAIATLIPNVTTAGGTVTLTGSYFLGATGVTIGGVPAASFNIVSNTSITAVLGAGATSGTVTVTNPTGTATFGGFVLLNPPVISYGSSKSFNVGSPITPAVPVNTGGKMPDNLYGNVITIAGSGAIGAVNGTGTAASFNGPVYTAVDLAGNIFVADAANNLVRKITPTGVVTTFAGTGVSGNTDGPGTSATFSGITAITSDMSGNVYVKSSDKLRKITPNGVVSTLVSISGSKIAADPGGNVYVISYPSLYRVSPQGTVVEVTNSETSRYIDFSSPGGAATDLAGNLYVADTDLSRIVKVTPQGLVRTVATIPPTNSSTNYTVSSVAIDAAGNIYFTNYADNLVKKLTPTGTITTLAGDNSFRTSDGIGTAASFEQPYGLSVGTDGNLYAAEKQGNTIRQINTRGYSVSPALPQGLSIDNTGTISGIPQIITPATDYTITAYNDSGSGQAVVNISTVASVIPPTVTSISPLSGPVGTVITINGTNLVNASVKVGTTPAVIVSNNNTQITAVVMPGTVNGSIAVTTNAGGATGGAFSVKTTPFPSSYVGPSFATAPNATNGAYIINATAISGDGRIAVLQTADFNFQVYVRSGANWLKQGPELSIAGAAAVTGYPDTYARFALNADGTTLVAASGSAEFGNTLSPGLRVFVRSGNTWAPQGMPLIVAGITSTLGENLAISADGNTIVAGATDENSNQGGAWVFTRTNGIWTQQGGKLVGTGGSATARQGIVAISADGNTIMSCGRTDVTSNPVSSSGACWIFTRSGTTWTQQGNKLSVAGISLGASAALSADGNTALTGAAYLDGKTGDNQNTAVCFTRSNGVWSSAGTLPVLATGNLQVPAVALSADGNTAVLTRSNYNNQTLSAIAVLGCYTRSGSTWTARGGGYSGLGSSGASVTMSLDGATAITAVAQYYNTSCFTFVAADAPVATTLPATNITNTAATLNGTVDDGGANTTATITYGTDAALAGATNATITGNASQVKAGSGPTAISAAITGLNKQTTYYYRVTGVNSIATQNGAILSFTTLADPPTITSFLPKVATTGSTITINGTNFTNVTAVSFGGVAAQSFVVNSATSITAKVDAGASGQVLVTAAAGTTNLSGFVYIPAPAIIAAGATSFTQGGSVALSTPVVTGYSYQWYKDGVAISGATTAGYTAAAAGSYTVGITLSGSAVVISAATVVTIPFMLPVNNFTTSVTSATCKGSANGLINITAKQVLNYTATVTGPDSRTVQFTTAANIPNLAAGTYNVCITVANQSSYQQCYTLVITEPKDLSVYSVVNPDMHNISLTLSGGDQYHIQLNGVNTTYADSVVTLPLAAGNNKLIVTTNRGCQGIVERSYFIADRVLPYPDPFENKLYINMGFDKSTTATVKIYTLFGRLVYQKQFINPDETLQLDVTELKNSGVYSLQLITDSIIKTFKIFRK